MERNSIGSKLSDPDDESGPPNLKGRSRPTEWTEEWANPKLVLTPEGELVEAQRLEAESNNRLEALEAQVQQLESGRSKVEAELDKTRALGFNRCRDIVVVLDPEVDLELMQLGH